MTSLFRLSNLAHAGSVADEWQEKKASSVARTVNPMSFKPFAKDRLARVLDNHSAAKQKVAFPRQRVHPQAVGRLW
jgi:hypothetical protein